jgi:uncharacterized protein (TIGR03067 family)
MCVVCTHATSLPATSTPAIVDETAFPLTMTPLLKQLQGEWAPITVITNGQPLPEAMLSFGSRTMTGNETTVIFGGQIMVHAKVRIDESTTPVGIDYLNLGGGAKDLTLGIIDLHGDVVRVCMASTDGSRPTEFSSDTGSGRILSEWKRK